MNYSLSWSLELPFSLFPWTLDIAFVTLVTSKFGFPLKNWHINMYHMHIWKKWTTPCPGPWSCLSRCSPGPSIWPLSPLKPLNLDSPWKISLWTCIMSLGLENKKYDKLLSGKNHVLVELCLLWVDAVHHEARSGPRPFDIMSATTKKDFRKRSHVDSIIFTEIRAKKPRGGAYLPPHALNRVNLKYYNSMDYMALYTFLQKKAYISVWTMRKS